MTRSEHRLIELACDRQRFQLKPSSFGFVYEGLFLPMHATRRVVSAFALGVAISLGAGGNCADDCPATTGRRVRHHRTLRRKQTPTTEQLHADSTSSSGTTPAPPQSSAPADPSQQQPALQQDQATPTVGEHGADYYNFAREVYLTLRLQMARAVLYRLKQQNLAFWTMATPERVIHFSQQTNLPLRVGILLDTSNSIRQRFQF